jgi:hypothetical protein
MRKGHYYELYAVDGKSKTVKIRHILNRNEDCKELKYIR